MFSPDEVSAIRKVAEELSDNAPSKSTFEWLAQIANEPTWTVEAVCLAIDNLACAGKLLSKEKEDEAHNDKEDMPLDNHKRSEKLQDLMRLLHGESVLARRRRAYALRTLNKLCHC